MSIIKELFDPAALPEDEPEMPQPSPEGTVRVHVFAGHFDSEADLFGYCFDSDGPDSPEMLTRDLPGAYIDTNYVATGYGTRVEEALADFFDPVDAAKISNGIGDANAVVIVSEHAFGGFPYTLGNTPKLDYVCERFVELP